MGAMTYSGHVDPGGPAALRELDAVRVHKLSVGPMDNNAYLLTCRASGRSTLIDAAAEPERILALLLAATGGTALDLVVTTHRHADHHGALAEVLARTGAAHACGAADADAIGAPADRVLRHRDTLDVGRVRLDVVALRGHTPGSVALSYREPARTAVPDAVPGRAHLFTGDSLFPGGPGRTAGPPEFRRLMADLDERVFGSFDDRTWVYPGHGDDTTLGAERPALPAWRARGW